MNDANPPTNARRGDRRNLLVAVLMLLAVGGLYAYRSRPAPMPAGWAEGFRAAKERAAQEKRPLLIEFSATWCGPCKQMARDVLPDPRVATAIRDFVAVSVDIDKEQDVAVSFNVESVPTFIVLDPAGREVHRFFGDGTVDGFLTEIAKARERLPKPA